MVLAKNWPFFQLFILGNIGEETVLRYSNKKKRLSKVEKQEVLKVLKLRLLHRG